MPRGRTAKTLAMVAECRAILAAIQPASIRAVCYQLFTRGLIPDMSKRSTNRINDILARDREQSDIPWRWIVDEHRAGEQVPSWDDPSAYADEILARVRFIWFAGKPRTSPAAAWTSSTGRASMDSPASTSWPRRSWSGPRSHRSTTKGGPSRASGAGTAWRS
jgi:hypothetical protein